MIVAGHAPGAPRSEPGSIRAAVLAVMVHAAFFALIVYGVRWQSTPTVPVEVEIWDKLPAAKPAPALEVPKTIEPETPPPKPVELKAPPAIEKPPEVKPDPKAEIAEKLERQKKEKAKLERERLEKLERQKAAEAKKRQEEEAKKKAEAEKKRREEESARREAEKAAEAAARARQSEVDQWIGRIRTKIRGTSNVPDTVRGNPEVEVLIHILPGGEVLDIKVTKRSGNAAYDSAIERGIRSASPLPVPAANSELFPQFRDLKLIIRHER